MGLHTKKHGAGFLFKRKIHPNYGFSKTHLTHNGQDTHLAFNVKWSVNFSLSPLNCFLIIPFKQLIARLSERVFSRERKCHSMKEKKKKQKRHASVIRPDIMLVVLLPLVVTTETNRKSSAVFYCQTGQQPDRELWPSAAPGISLHQFHGHDVCSREVSFCSTPHSTELSTICNAGAASQVPILTLNLSRPTH